MIFKALLGLFLISFLECSPKKSMVLLQNSECNIEAVVRDYTGLDGCRFLLELKDGSRLIPVELVDNTFLFSEGQVVKIKYAVMKEAVTACLTAATPVQVTCIQQIKAGIKTGQEFMKRDCIDTDTPLTVSWMNRMVIRDKVTEVKKGYLNTDPYYIFIGNVNAMIFNCKGELVCEYAINSNSSSCESKFKILTDLKPVWAQK